MSLADRLKQVRDKLGYTQKEIAEAINTNPQTWRVYESGKSVPGGNVFEALARLGFDVNWILTGEGEMRKKSEINSSVQTTIPVDKDGEKLIEDSQLAKLIEEETERFRKIVAVIEESASKYDVDLIREKKLLLTMTLFNIFGRKLCDIQSHVFPKLVDNLVKLCIPDEQYADIEDAYLFLDIANHEIGNNDIEHARKCYFICAKIINQIVIAENGKWSKELKAIYKKCTDFVEGDSVYINGLAELKTIIQNHDGILQTDLYRSYPDLERETISYIIYFAVSAGIIERTKKGRTYELRAN